MFPVGNGKYENIPCIIITESITFNKIDKSK